MKYDLRFRLEVADPPAPRLPPAPDEEEAMIFGGGEEGVSDGVGEVMSSSSSRSPFVLLDEARLELASLYMWIVELSLETANKVDIMLKFIENIRAF